MGGAGNDVGILQGVVQQTCSDQAGGVCHVDHEQCAHAVGNLAHALVVPLAAVGAGATDDQLGTLALCDLFHLVVVNEVGLEHQTREVNGATM